jgi:type IV pilus biogenesis protein CpaD/CtpE
MIPDKRTAQATKIEKDSLVEQIVPLLYQIDADLLANLRDKMRGFLQDYEPAAACDCVNINFTQARARLLSVKG